MAVFQGLSEKLNHIFSKLTKRGKLTELEIKQAMREVRIALLEADVNLSVAKDFIAKVSEKAVGYIEEPFPRAAGYQNRKRRVDCFNGFVQQQTYRFVVASHGYNDVRSAGRGQDHALRKTRIVS